MPRGPAPLFLGLALLLGACASSDDAESPPAAEEDATEESDLGPDATEQADERTGDVAPEGDEDDPGEAADPGPDAPELSVVATLAPIADLVEQVGGDRVEVDSLVPAGADAHTYEPRPQDVVVLSEADSYLGIGLDLNDGAIALAEENLPADAPLVLLGEQMLGDDALVFDHSHDHGEGGHSHDDDAGHSHGDDGDTGHSHGDEGGHSHGDDGDTGHSHGDDGDTGHSHGDDAGGLGPNPHVWTSLRNAILLVEGIAAALADLDPEGAERYEANAEAYIGQLEDLDDVVTQAAATIPDDGRTLVTYHDAWTYFARDHDLDFATAVQPSDFSDPSASEVRAVIDLIRDLEVSVVFGSEVFPTPVLETIAQETGAEYRGDLSDDVLPGQRGDREHTYLEMMRRNAVTIVDGLGGDASELRSLDDDA